MFSRGPILLKKKWDKSMLQQGTMRARPSWIRLLFQIKSVLGDAELFFLERTELSFSFCKWD